MFVYVQLSQIDDNPFQARQEYGDVAELAADIMRQAATRPDTRGLQQIPTARLVGDDDGLLIPIAGLDKADFMDGDKLRPRWRVQLEFGHRRKRAFDYLFQKGIAEYCYMPVDLRDLDDNQMLDGVWQENRSRRDLSAVEEAELLESKLARSASQREVADAWGIDRSTVANRLRLLKLPESLKDANRTGTLSERQCLSLATAAQLETMLDGDDLEWGSASRQTSFGLPPSPSQYIQHIIANPGTNSNEIRDVTKKILDHAGVLLPQVIADYECEIGEHVIQPLCRGCPMRINNHCLNAGCVEQKKTSFNHDTLEAVAAELDLPISDTDAHFEQTYQFREQLAVSWQAGNRENMVVGWRGGVGFRPFSETRHVYADKEIYEGDGRAAIIIGHTTGSLPSTPGAEPEDIADTVQVDAWRTRAGKILFEAKKTAKAALREALYESINEYRPLMALAQKPDVETTDDPGELNSAFLEFMWKRGMWLSYTPATFTEEWEYIGDMLERAGIGRAILRHDDRAADLSQRSVMWLSYWYYYRQHHYANERWQAAHSAITSLRSEYERIGFLSGDLLDLSIELDRAARDIAAKMAG